MFDLFRIALRNLTRSKARNSITLGAILAGVLMTLFLSAYMTGMQNALVKDTVEARVGALQIHRKGYLDVKENQPLKLDLPQGGELEEKLRRTPGVHEVTPRIVFSGLVSTGSTSTLFVGQGVDPVREAKVLPRAHDDVKGHALGTDTPQGAVVGSELAAALGVAPGSSLTVQATSQNGQENALDVDVTGTLESGTLFESKRLITLPLPYVQKLLRMNGRVTEYMVSVERIEEIDLVAAALRKELGSEYEVHTWAELRPAIHDALQFQSVFLSIISMVFLIITVFGVVNTLLMSVMERTREIGTMMAVGVRRGQIATLFVLEAAIQAILGGAVGAILAYALVAFLSRHGGIPMKLPGSTMSLEILPVITRPWVIRALVSSTLGAMLAALYPALKAASLRPVEALRAT